MPSKIKKRSNGYLLTVVHEQTEYTKITHVTTKTEAEKEWAIFANEVFRSHITARSEGNMTLNQFYTYWTKNYAETNQAISTQETNANIYIRIGAILGHIKLSKIKPRHILEFTKQLASPTASVQATPLSTAYIQKHMSLLRTMLNSACQWGFITDNPANKVKTPKGQKAKKKHLIESHLEAFFATFDQANTKHKLWIALAFALGLRREELFGLQWQDINFDQKTLSIERVAIYVAKKGIFIKDAKSENSDRTLPIPQSILKLFIAWKTETITQNQKKDNTTPSNVIPLSHHPDPTDFLFQQKDGTVGHPHAFNNFLSRFCKKANIPLISPHQLRHMYGSYLLAGGVNLATVSSLLGHSDKSFTLKTYIHELKSLESHTATIMDSTMTQLKKHKEI